MSTISWQARSDAIRFVERDPNFLGGETQVGAQAGSMGVWKTFQAASDVFHHFDRLNRLRQERDVRGRRIRHTPLIVVGVTRPEVAEEPHMVGVVLGEVNAPLNNIRLAASLTGYIFALPFDSDQAMGHEVRDPDISQAAGKAAVTYQMDPSLFLKIMPTEPPRSRIKRFLLERSVKTELQTQAGGGIYSLQRLAVGTQAQVLAARRAAK